MAIYLQTNTNRICQPATNYRKNLEKVIFLNTTTRSVILPKMIFHTGMQLLGTPVFYALTTSDS